MARGEGVGGRGEGAVLAGEDEGFGDGFELFPALADDRGFGRGDLMVGGGGGDGGEEVGEVLDDLVVAQGAMAGGGRRKNQAPSQPLHARRGVHLALRVSAIDARPQRDNTGAAFVSPRGLLNEKANCPHRPFRRIGMAFAGGFGRIMRFVLGCVVHRRNIIGCPHLLHDLTSNLPAPAPPILLAEPGGWPQSAVWLGLYES